MSKGTDNLKPCRSKEEARERGRKGGQASGAARRERKTLAETLRAALNEEAGTSGLTKQQVIVARLLDNMNKGNVKASDLKVIADILGETVTNVNVKGDGIHVEVNSTEQAEAIKKIIG